mgnify:CR=1 FL=1
MLDWLASPSAWIGLLTLTVLEIVLGIDNIIFISILAGKLPQADRGRARKLGLSRNTVRNHGAALYRKIGIHKRSEAVVWGRENGFPLNISDG